MRWLNHSVEADAAEAAVASAFTPVSRKLLFLAVFNCLLL